MKRSTLLASTAALLLSAGVAVAADEAAKQQPANDMPPPPHGDRQKPHHSDKMRNKFKRDGLPRGFDELGLSEEQKSKIRAIMAQYRPQQPENHLAKILTNKPRASSSPNASKNAPSWNANTPNANCRCSKPTTPPSKC